MTSPQILEIGSEWYAPDVADESIWTEFFDESEREEHDLEQDEDGKREKAHGRDRV